MANTVEPIGPVSESTVVISETFLDVFGHVNNAGYLTLFEQARWEIVGAKGFSVPEIMALQQGPVILEVRLQFKREIRAREKIRIRTFVTQHQGKITHLRQIMLKENDDEGCIADLVCALFDLRARKLIEPTEDWKKAIGIA